MVADKYNFHKVQFELESLETEKEKLTFLYTTKKELRKIILDLESWKMLPYRMYAEANVPISDAGPEFGEIVKEIIDKNTRNPRDKRYPSDDYIRRELKKYILKFFQLDSLIQSEIDELNKIHREAKQAEAASSIGVNQYEEIEYLYGKLSY